MSPYDNMADDRRELDRAKREAAAYKWAYEYLQSRMESIGRHGWARDCDPEIEHRIADGVAIPLDDQGEQRVKQLTLAELWDCRDRALQPGEYELAIQLLFARNNDLPLTDEERADLDQFLARPVGVAPSPAPPKE